MLRVSFTQKGLKIRAASAAFGAVVWLLIVGHALWERLARGLTLLLWVPVGGACLILFGLVYRTDEEGEFDLRMVPVLVPWPVLAPGMLLLTLVFAFELNLSLGRWELLDSSWSGEGLYFVFCVAVAAYNLLRLNLQRWLGR